MESSQPDVIFKYKSYDNVVKSYTNCQKGRLFVSIFQSISSIWVNLFGPVLYLSEGIFKIQNQLFGNPVILCT